jgi:hypothetical protein
LKTTAYEVCRVGQGKKLFYSSISTLSGLGELSITRFQICQMNLASSHNLGRKLPKAPVLSVQCYGLCGGGSDLSRDPLGGADFRFAQIVGALEIQLRTRIATKMSRKPHGRISRDAAPLTNNIIDSWRGYAE